MRSSPIVSIGLPVYNGQRYLQETLDSILAQTFHDFELIISDNASGDKTREICEAYAIRDKRVKYIRHDVNKGAKFNYNYVFEISTGKYFKWSAYDDTMAPDFLKKCVSGFEKYRNVVLCFPLIVDIDENGKQVEIRERRQWTSDKIHERFFNFIGWGYNCEEIFGVIRSDILKKTGLIRSYTDSDRTLLGELSLYGHFYQEPETTFYHRVHPERSAAVYRDWQERAVWFDPSLKGRIVMSAWKQLFDYFLILYRTPLSAVDKIRCYIELARLIKWRYQWYLKELNWGLKQILNYKRVT